jgi:integrase
MGVKVKSWKGGWWLFIDHKGRRKAKRVGVGKGGLRAARAAAEKIQAKLALGETALLDETRDPALTVTAFVEDWLKHHVAAHCKPGTAEKYEMIFRKHWLPAVGHLPLIAVTREHIKAVLAEKLSADLKPRTVKGHLDVLRACLAEAVEDKLILINPAARLGKVVPRSGDNQEIDIFKRAEVTTFLEVAERDMPDAYPIVLTLARTGLRIGEALTLQADDVDFAQRTLWVRRTWGSRKKALGDRRINAPKSNRIRRVDMSNQLTRVLQGLLAVREAEAIVTGRERSPWLFLGGGDGPMTPGAFWQNVWRPLLRRAGIRYRKPHTLRHTYASLLIQTGESLAYIRDQLGHHSIKLTVDTYGHLVPGANRAAVDKLDDATGRNLYATGTR